MRNPQWNCIPAFSANGRPAYGNPVPGLPARGGFGDIDTGDDFDLGTGCMLCPIGVYWRLVEPRHPQIRNLDATGWPKLADGGTPGGCYR